MPVSSPRPSLLGGGCLRLAVRMPAGRVTPGSGAWGGGGQGSIRMAVHRRRVAPPPPLWTTPLHQSDHRGDKQHLPLGKSCWAILMTQTVGSQTPPFNTSPGRGETRAVSDGHCCLCAKGGGGSGGGCVRGQNLRVQGRLWGCGPGSGAEGPGYTPPPPQRPKGPSREKAKSTIGKM